MLWALGPLPPTGGDPGNRDPFLWPQSYLSHGLLTSLLANIAWWQVSFDVIALNAFGEALAARHCNGLIPLCKIEQRNSQLRFYRRIREGY
jgi:hypothetical protein